MMTRRKPASWMRQTDERILEHLDGEYSSTPSLMEEVEWIRAPEDEIKDRCLLLSSVDLVSRIAGRTYEISLIGEHFLQGNIDMRVGFHDVQKICSEEDIEVKGTIGFDELCKRAEQDYILDSEVSWK